jgi:parallel beta-helix repeat protein
MKLESVFLMVFLIVLVVSSPEALGVQRVEASGTIYIRADGRIDPPTTPISTIDNVTYTFADDINDWIVVERDSIVVDGQGYTVQGTWGGTGITLSGRSNVTIKNTEITAFATGIWLSHSPNNSFSGNNITKNGEGIWLSYSSNNGISGNNITSNGEGIELWTGSNYNSVSGNNITANSEGIWLAYSSNNSISGNNITANSYCGIWLDSSSNNNSVSGNTFTDDGLNVWDSYSNIVENNTVNGRPLVYLESVADFNIEDAGQVVLVKCDRMRVENLNLSRASFGVELWETNNSIISGNNITANRGGYPIELVYSCNNSISGNIMTNNSEGMFLFGSSNNSMDRNRITGNNITDSVIGIGLSESSNYNSITGNDVAANSWGGIKLENCLDTNIVNNDITDNDLAGIWLFFSNSSLVSQNRITRTHTAGIILDISSNNTILENDVRDNHANIVFEYSVNDGVALSSDNRIFHNNFINGTWNAVTHFSGQPENFYDDGYPSGGNFWSDYNGTDLFGGRDQNETGRDAIGDTEYFIDGNNTDNYPLMGMFSEFDWVSLAAPEQRIQTICNSTISNLVYNGTAIGFNVTGEDGTAGFCRIRIPTILLNVTYKVFVNGTEATYRLLPFSNETYRYLYFNYTHSTQEVTIIPESPSFLILPLFFMATLLAAITYRRKHH